MRRIEAAIKMLRIPVNAEGGLVIGELNPIVDETGEIDSSDPISDDELITANMEMILHDLGATHIAAFGAFNKFRWQYFADVVPGVASVDIVDADREVHLRVWPPARLHEEVPESESPPSAAEAEEEPEVKVSDSKEREQKVNEGEHDVHVFLGNNPCWDRRAAYNVLSACYGLSKVTSRIESIEPVDYKEPKEYAPFEVDGNHRYLLANGILTHNWSGRQGRGGRHMRPAQCVEGAAIGHVLMPRCIRPLFLSLSSLQHVGVKQLTIPM
jgi:hypothetical protein